MLASLCMLWEKGKRVFKRTPQQEDPHPLKGNFPHQNGRSLGPSSFRSYSTPLGGKIQVMGEPAGDIPPGGRLHEPSCPVRIPPPLSMKGGAAGAPYMDSRGWVPNPPKSSAVVAKSSLFCDASEVGIACLSEIAVHSSPPCAFILANAVGSASSLPRGL